MKLHIYNSLTHSKELFAPLKKDKIGLYVCGPTVYDAIHIGNARCFIIFDILYRILLKLYPHYTIYYVRNITDIDDKIKNRAKKLNISIKELTTKTTEIFHKDLSYLQCLKPTIEPKATEHIKEIIEIIQRLINKNIAYIKNGNVYFKVKEFPNYSQLSSRNFDYNISGTRVNISDDKNNEEDFILWKKLKKEEDINSAFDSPWGLGSPGWHIECSAMSHKYLGEDFDIHGGGIDLIFPHHTNEIAQSKCAFNNSQYAKYWMHNGFLTVNKKKMSKSLGNFITVNSLRNKNINGEIIRLTLLQTHYRKPLDYSDKSLQDSKKMLDSFYYIVQDVEENNDKLPEEFITSISDDLNINQGLAFMHMLSKKIDNTNSKEEKNKLILDLKNCGCFLGILKSKASNWFKTKIDINEIKKLLKTRELHKKNKNWQEADNIRNILKEKNIIVKDNKDGTSDFIVCN